MTSQLKRNNLKPNYNNDLIFQVIDWKANDFMWIEDMNKSSDESSDEELYTNEKKLTYDYKYTIKMYGVTKEGLSVCAHIVNFEPYFYIKCQSNWGKSEMNKILLYLKMKLKRNKENIKSVKLVEKKEFYKFSNNKYKNFIKIKFKTIGAFYECKKILSNPLKIQSLSNSLILLKLYESNIDPLLRFMHIRDINSCGWIKINKGEYEKTQETLTRCQYDIKVDYNEINNYETDDIAPLLVASFDIECTSGDGSFPQEIRPSDKIIQIGTTIRKVGEKECYIKHIVTLKDCDKIDGVIVESFKTEKKLLKAWAKMIQNVDPDIITGYNIWGFDFKYIFNRIKYNKLNISLLDIGRSLRTIPKNLLEKNKLNDEEFSKIEKIVFKNKSLESAALGQNFLYYIETEGRVQIDLYKLVQRDYKLDTYKLDFVAETFMGLNKIDLSPQQLFKNYSDGSIDKITEIAEYCIKDCELCNDLMDKLCVVPNNIGMANVCTVPLSYLFLRGQGIKAQSLVSRFCRLEDFVIPVLQVGNVKESYEGAVVLPPKIGIYLNEPVAVTDYKSLYPSSMIAENISHDSYISEDDYNIKREYYDSLKDYSYNIVEYDVTTENVDKFGNKIKIKKTCVYAEHKKNKAVIPRILQKLLEARKNTRKKIKTEKDAFKISILEGLQLAFKLTANSIYGQCGASTSAICFKELAASTTAVGRRMLEFARDHTLKTFPGSVCVYGDTDSVFIKFKLPDNLSDEDKLKKAIELGQESAEEVNKHLKNPQELEYEKTFFPFILFSKKRYIGNLYEFDTKKFKQKSMGIVLKRRDNAKILKDIYGGVVDCILNKKDIELAKSYFKKEVENLLLGNVDLNKLIITKTIKYSYKTPSQIAHCILAWRMGDRDIGTKPASNERMSYIYIDISKQKCYCCDRLINIKECKCIGCSKLYCKEHLNPKYHAPCVLKCRGCNIELIKNYEHNEDPDNCNLCDSKIKNINNNRECQKCNGWYCNRKNNCYDIHKCGNESLSCKGCGGFYCKKHMNIRLPDDESYDGHKCSTLSNKALQGDLIEDPKYIIENKIPPDYRYYYEHQIETPILQIFDLAMKDSKSLVKDILRKDDNKKKGNIEITKWFTSSKSSNDNLFDNFDSISPNIKTTIKAKKTTSKSKKTIKSEKTNNKEKLIKVKKEKSIKVKK